MRPAGAIHRIGTREEINAALLKEGIEARYYPAKLGPGQRLQSWTERQPNGHTCIWRIDPGNRYELVGLGFRPGALGQITPLTPAPDL